MKHKYIILSLLTILLTTPSYSQSLKDLLEGKSVYIPESAKEKEDTVSVSGVETKAVESDLIYKAVAPALKIVKQQYRLKKDGDFFGKNNKPHFGEASSLAVKVAGGTILQHEVLYPWVNDKDYQDANESGKYTPVLYDSYQKSINGNKFEKVDLELGTPYVRQIGKDSLLYVHYDAYSDFGLDIDSSSGKKDGYMLWIYDSEKKYEYTVEALSVNSSVDVTVISMETSAPDAILGGVYVIPVVERPGTISFHLVGVASTLNNKDWSLKLLTKEESSINIIN